MNERKSIVRQFIPLAALLAILFIIVCVLVWNTSELHAVLNNSTEQYVQDVSYQITSDISSRFDMYKRILEHCADRIPGIKEQAAVDAYLLSNAQSYGFDSLSVISVDTVTAEQKEVEGIERSFNGATAVTYMEGQFLLFSTPIYTNGSISSILTGVRNQKNIQALIRPKSFGGEGLTCIIDSDGQVVISPQDVKPFLQLDHIFISGTDKQMKAVLEQMQSDMQKGKPGVFPFTAVDGSRLLLSYRSLDINDWVLLTLVPANLISSGADSYTTRTFLIIGCVVLVFSILFIVTVRFYRKTDKQLKKVAYSDSLTGGMNQMAFQMYCRALSQQDMYTVVYLNMKGFKYINEHWEHAAGDRMLQYVYQVIARHLRDGEPFARCEADHFFLCLREREPARIQKRLDAIRASAMAGDFVYRIILLQGACALDGADIAVVQDRARIACQMRESDEVCMFYSAQLLQRIKEEQELTSLFEESIQNHDFQIYLQPKMRLGDGSVGGAEALVRWIHPQRGIIYPSVFIPLFEKNGQICKLDLYVFEEVLKLLHKWIESGKPLVPVSVNLSRIHFKNADFLQAFWELKEKYRIPDKIVELELTESIFFHEPEIEFVKGCIRQMHMYGFLCSLDDVGAGFSSLGLLKEFNVDTIKLDRKFFDTIENSKTQNIIACLVELAHKLHIHVVAEGIETAEQLSFLRSIQCEMVQGYVFYKPLTIAEFEKIVE